MNKKNNYGTYLLIEYLIIQMFMIFLNLLNEVLDSNLNHTSISDFYPVWQRYMEVAI